MTTIERVAHRFGLGELVAEPQPVTGGLSNELWRVTAREGDFAVKRMIVNADHPDFIANVEASFAVERRAAAAGVAMPHPVPDPSTGRALAPERMLVVDSHRDLDRKNTLRTAEHGLLALDWDAAGPVSAVHEAVSVALDFSDGEPVPFAEALRAYAESSEVEVPAQPWIFGGWVAAQGGWLDFNATQRRDSPLGRAEAAKAVAGLRKLASSLDVLLAAG